MRRAGATSRRRIRSPSLFTWLLVYARVIRTQHRECARPPSAAIAVAIVLDCERPRVPLRHPNNEQPAYVHVPKAGPPPSPACGGRGREAPDVGLRDAAGLASK